MAFSELIALYLFLGGTSAGCFAVCATIELRAFVPLLQAARGKGMRRPPTRHFHDAARRHVLGCAYAAALAMILVGLVCLVADLGRPEVFYYLLLYPTDSFMSLGVFALALFTACLVLVSADSSLALGAGWRRAARVARLVGMPAAVVVMVYTGMLLKSAMAVSVWQSCWLPVLFLFSSLSCGCAVVLLSACASEGYAGVRPLMRGLAGADAAFVALETASAIAYVITLGVLVKDPLVTLTTGSLTSLFWVGFVGCGILSPLFLDVRALATGQPQGNAVLASIAVLSLVGGASLRFALVTAGVQAA